MIADQKFIEIMTIVANPKDSMNWPKERKIDRYQRVLRWHDWMQKLSPTIVPYLWGSHQILSQVSLSPAQHIVVAVYRVPDLASFDRLLLSDPLREVSTYATFLLDDIWNDFDADKEKLKRQETFLFSDGRDDKIVAHEQNRLRYIGPPEYVDKYPLRVPPPNPVVPYYPIAAMSGSAPPVQVLINARNVDQQVSWDDSTKLIHYEKVQWWFHYLAKMIADGKVSHAWANHDFCDAAAFSYRTASSTHVFGADSLEDFNEAYKIDPLRQRAAFWSIFLKPINDQRTDDEEALTRSKDLV